ncbi:MAG: cysteine desulfurase NifS [Elusimicrobia bacterium RIFOXYD2_FULL_34_15]|nr:MAG: cysteine desulfurase NifS [Elusimicrobia bacterium RIFOXYD2_FULL_34_15]
MGKKIYIDHNATTPVHPEVLSSMLPYFKEFYGNPSSIHSFGQETRKAIEDSREKVAKLLGAESSEIIFTSCGTESNNHAIKGTAFALQNRGNHIITSKIEHHAVIEVCEYLSKKFGFEITYIPVDKHGIIDPEDVKKAITDKTILISIMHINNEIGTIQPIEELGKIAQEKQIVFHTDAVQSGGKIQIDVKKLGVSLLSLSGHKFYAPKGAGILYIKKGLKIHSLLHGGSHEKNRRAGTENVPYIVGIAKALELSYKDMSKESKRLLQLREKLEKGIVEKIEYVQINGHPSKRIFNTSNISFDFIEGEGLLLSLDLEGIAASTGSACTSGTLEPSHVLSAMGVSVTNSQGSIRFSLGHQNTEEDIDKLLDVLPKIVSRLRSMSPLWEDKQKGVKTQFEDPKKYH